MLTFFPSGTRTVHHVTTSPRGLHVPTALGAGRASQRRDTRTEEQGNDPAHGPQLTAIPCPDWQTGMLDGSHSYSIMKRQ